MSALQHERLRKYRKAAGRSRDEIGHLIGRGYFSVAAYETGRVVPPVGVLEKWADACGVPVGAFFSNEAVAS